MSIKSKLLVFFSADIAGSTAYKNSKTIGKGWIDLFTYFYSYFPKTFINKENDSEKLENDIKYWKSIGDELLFYYPLDSLSEVEILISKFIEMIAEFNEQLKEKYSGYNLALKGTVWIAGFPVINKEVSIEGTPDFIGPQIDRGFRISKYATPSRLIVSVEVAYILASESWRGKIMNSLYYEDNYDLKGVFSRSYPVFFVNMSNDSEFYRLKLQGLKECNPKDALNYCEKYIDEINNPYSICIPYLGDIPNYHKLCFEEVRKHDEEIQLSLESESVENLQGEENILGEVILKIGENETENTII